MALDPRSRQKNVLKGVREIRVIASPHDKSSTAWYEVARIGGSTIVAPEEIVQKFEVTTHHDFFKVNALN